MQILSAAVKIYTEQSECHVYGWYFSWMSFWGESYLSNIWYNPSHVYSQYNIECPFCMSLLFEILSILLYHKSIISGFHRCRLSHYIPRVTCSDSHKQYEITVTPIGRGIRLIYQDLLEFLVFSNFPCWEESRFASFRENLPRKLL